MHELSIALSILDIAADESERRGGAAVTAIHIKLGPLSGVVKQALESAYELARESSPFADSRLVIEETPVTVRCKVCRSEQPVVSLQMLSCSRCGTPSADIVSGRELDIIAMEIEEPCGVADQFVPCSEV